MTRFGPSGPDSGLCGRDSIPLDTRQACRIQPPTAAHRYRSTRRRLDLDARAHGRADSETFFTYVPLAPGGLALTTASTNALMFSTSACLGEARLADAGVDDAGLLDAELDRAALGALARRRRHPSSPCRRAGSASGRAGPAPYRAGRRGPSCRASRCSGRS